MVFDNSSNNIYILSNIFDNLSIFIDMVTVCGFVFPRQEQLAHGGLSPSFPLGIANSLTKSDIRFNERIISTGTSVSMVHISQQRNT